MSLVKFAQQGDVAELRKLVLEGHTIDEKDAQGFTALMHAADAGKADAVRFLLDEGARPALESENDFEFGMGSTARSLAQAKLAARTNERAGTGRSWKEQNPESQDPIMVSYTEVVLLLKTPASGA